MSRIHVRNPHIQATCEIVEVQHFFSLEDEDCARTILGLGKVHLGDMQVLIELMEK